MVGATARQSWMLSRTYCVVTGGKSWWKSMPMLVPSKSGFHVLPVLYNTLNFDTRFQARSSIMQVLIGVGLPRSRSNQHWSLFSLTAQRVPGLLSIACCGPRSLTMFR